MSRSHRFQLRTNAPRVPSGDIASGLPSDDVPALPARPPRPPPRPCVAAAVSRALGSGQPGIAGAQTVRVLLAGSTRIVCVDPLESTVRYQKRSSLDWARDDPEALEGSSGIQFAATLPPTTSPATAGARNDSARA